jgi:hypothetical protein
MTHLAAPSLQGFVRPESLPDLFTILFIICNYSDKCQVFSSFLTPHCLLGVSSSQRILVAAAFAAYGSKSSSNH